MEKNRKLDSMFSVAKLLIYFSWLKIFFNILCDKVKRGQQLSSQQLPSQSNGAVHSSLVKIAHITTFYLTIYSFLQLQKKQIMTLERI